MKFLVFICFALSMLSGFGLEEALKGVHKPNPRLDRRVTKWFLSLISFFAVLFSAIYVGLTFLRPYTDALGRWLIRKFIFGHIGRPHSLADYDQKLNDFLDLFLSIYSVHYIWALWTVGVIAFGAILILFLRAGKKFRLLWLIFGFLYLFFDLYTFAWFDIKKDFNTYAAAERSSAIVDRLKEEKAGGLLERLYGFRRLEDDLPLVPSVNMLYGIEDIGAYSPFILRRYFETIGTFGNVNDSNAAFSPTSPYVLNRLPLLSALGVSHILSKLPLSDSSLKLLLFDPTSNSYLYRNERPHAKAFFVTRLGVRESWEDLKMQLMNENFDPRQTLLLEKSEARKLNLSQVLSSHARASLKHQKEENEQAIWQVQTDGPGFFVVMDTMYPGWHATVNGQAKPIVYAYGLFKAIWLERAGAYEIIFRYSLFHRRLD